MFERFSEQARRVLFFAREEASQLGSMRIDTEHLLLGLIRDAKGLTHRLFSDTGTALEDIRHGVLRRVPARSKTSTSPAIPFSAAAQRVLQHSAEEADRLLHDGWIVVLSHLTRSPWIKVEPSRESRISGEQGSIWARRSWAL
jgi:ATP-dependent Clp protease ATP-binding subunit ClpC